MKRLFFILIPVITLFSVKTSAQCVSVRSGTTICQGSTLSDLGGKMLRGTTAIIWTDNGAGGTFSPNATTLAASWTPAGTYTGTATLTLTSTAGCSSSTKKASFTVTVTRLPFATISYAGSPFCKNITTAQPVTRTGTSGGRYSSTTGLTINATSGAITPSTSTAGSYTVIYTIAAAGGCGVVTTSTSVTVSAVPSAPGIAFINQPSCSTNTGVVGLSGLPPTENWVITSNPLGIILSGSGLSANFSDLSPGAYTFTVTTANLCTSKPSISAVINSAPPVPSAPIIGAVAPSKCSEANGSVELSGLPVSGTWTLIRTPGGLITTGTGPTTTVSLLAEGTYTFTVTNSYGCISLPSASVVIIDQPSSPTAPVIETVSQPTCSVSTGIVVLSGLPGSGNWTITRNPGGVILSGTGTTATISAILAGSYTFIVSNSSGCSSPPSLNVLINAQPLIPTVPVAGAITPPGCTVSTGSVVLTGLPSSGTWTLTRYPGTVTSTGSGTNTTISGLQSGTYNFTVTTKDGCVSVPSANIIIPSQPALPNAPVVGTITQPTLTLPTGSVFLSGLPASGNWIITRSPGGVTTTGTGTVKTITNLEAGVYTFTVSNSAGCISPSSEIVIITSIDSPVLIITNPEPVCSPALADITSSSVTAGSSPGLTYTYWTDTGATVPFSSPRSAGAGTYYIKGTNMSGGFNIKPVIVTVNTPPVPDAGIDQTLDYKFSTTLNATIKGYGSGVWSLVSGTCDFSDNTNPKTQVSNLSLGDNLLAWTVKEGSCPAVSDTVRIVVHNLVIPTMITPNMDGVNDYFVLNDISLMGKTEIYVFDRRGVVVYKNLDYNNKWNGIDNNSKPLPDDTYFYIIRPHYGKPLNGFIVIRK